MSETRNSATSGDNPMHGERVAAYAEAIERAVDFEGGWDDGVRKMARAAVALADVELAEAEDRGWQKGYELGSGIDRALAHQIRREVTLNLGSGVKCHACGRPIDEPGCQYRSGNDGIKVHLLDPGRLGAELTGVDIRRCDCDRGTRERHTVGEHYGPTAGPVRFTGSSKIHATFHPHPAPTVHDGSTERCAAGSCPTCRPGRGV